MSGRAGMDAGTHLCSLKAKVLSNSQLAVIMRIVLATGGRYLMKTFILKFCILTVSIIHSFPQLLKGGLVVISGRHREANYRMNRTGIQEADTEKLPNWADFTKFCHK